MTYLGILWGFGVTLLRGLRRPNDWAEAHWLINYDFGLLKRALPGTLLKPLISPGYGALDAEATISFISFVITAILCVVLLGMSYTILHAKHTNGNNGFAANAILVVSAFVTSPFIVMSGHLNGYFDHQIILLSCFVVLLVLRGRPWVAAIVITLGLLIHETILVIGFPAVLWAALLKFHVSNRSSAPRRTADLIRQDLLPFLLPVLLFALLFWHQSFSFDARTLEQILTEHLKTFSFIQYDQEVIVPRAYTKSFIAYLQTQGPRFWDRLFIPGLLVSILSNLLLLLIFTRNMLYGRIPKSLIITGTLISFLPLSLHLIAWDTSRIWTYPLIVALLVVWVGCKVVPNAYLAKDESLLLSVGCLIVIVMNVFWHTPLMDWRVERFSAAMRVLLYLPLFFVVVKAFSWNFQPFKRVLAARRFPVLFFSLTLLIATQHTPLIPPAAATETAVLNYAYLPLVRVPPIPKISLVPFASGFNTDTITDIAHAGDNRLFVVQRNGIIRIVHSDGSIQPLPFLNISSNVSNLNWEEGLLGLVFHPNFPATPDFYVTYTANNSRLTVARYSLDPTNHNVAEPQSVRYLMVIDKPPANGGPSRVHNAGDMAFGPDGYLYIGLGDGGPDPFDPNGVPGDPFNHGQRRDVLWGKVLRIDPDPARGLPADCGRDYYSIPPDNPFLGDDGCDEIWATGLRNPWRFSFDRLNGDFYMADVGEWIAEEINYQPAGAGAGANYGWHCFEGIDDYTGVHPELAPDCDPQTQYTFPAYFYDHSNNDCSVVGGFVYRGEQYPLLYGRYLYGDFCTGRTWTMARNENGEWVVAPAGETGVFISTFGEAANGELYAGTWLPDHGNNNSIYHIVVE